MTLWTWRYEPGVGIVIVTSIGLVLVGLIDNLKTCNIAHEICKAHNYEIY